jgi:hypothetical protein
MKVGQTFLSAHAFPSVTIPHLKRLFKRVFRRERAPSSGATEPDDIEITYSGGDGVSIRFPDEKLITCAVVTKLDDQLYRLESIPLLSEGAAFGDVIEGECLTDGSLRFRRVVQRSGYRLYSFLLPREERHSNEIRRVLGKVDSAGGHWERVCGEVLLICLPPNVEWDPTPEVLS